MCSQDQINKMIDSKVEFARGQFINKDQFNTMSECFSEQFTDFKEEVI